MQLGRIIPGAPKLKYMYLPLELNDARMTLLAASADIVQAVEVPGLARSPSAYVHTKGGPPPAPLRHGKFRTHHA